MKVELKTLKPNPTRDLKVDPIDPAIIRRLGESIHDDGFWGGVVCRQVSDLIQIAAGQHRVKAAIEEEIQFADVFIGDFDDFEMQRIYTRENATQRGNSA